MSEDSPTSTDNQQRRVGEESEHELDYNPSPKEYEQFVDFFENAAVPMHWVGPDGTVLHANQAELDALGYSREEYVGNHIAEFHADQEVIEDILDRLSSDEELENYEARMERKDGSIRHVLIDSCVNWEDGDFVNTRCVTRDITERKERERELQETKSRLETAVTDKERQNEAFHSFHDIITDPTLTFDQQMHDVLSLGVDYLDLDIGLISDIDPPDYTVEHVVTPDGSIEQGDVLDFRDTFCTLVFKSEGPVAFRSPAEGGVEDHPCYQDMGIQAYLGEPLIVDGTRHGTLNFSSSSQREDAFTDGERAFIRTVSEWVTAELSRHRQKQELERYAAMAETVQDGICILNRDSEFVEVNNAFTELTGYNRSELLGSHASLVRPEELNDKFDQMQASLETESDVEAIEMDVQRADGSTRVVYARYGRFARQDGVGRVGVWRDITERKQREERLARQRSLLEAEQEAGLDGELVVDEDGQIVTYNDRFLELWGVPEELVEAGEHEPVLDWISSQVANPEQFRDRIEEMHDHPEETTRDEIELADGRMLDQYSAPLIGEDDTHYGQIWTSQDITDRLERERRLRRERDRLDEFASVISHDLRNPLRVAEGNLHLAMEDDDLDPLETVSASLDHMDTLIEDLLSLANAGESLGETESLELAALAEISWRNVDTASSALDLDADRSIRADETRLQQLLENLLRNAVEHGGDDVTVTVGDLPDGFYVEDDGPGIPPEERGDVLDAGYSTREDGTGFGLNIVHDIAEAHGWVISITESIDGGARFEFSVVETE